VETLASLRHAEEFAPTSYRFKVEAQMQSDKVEVPALSGAAAQAIAALEQAGVGYCMMVGGALAGLGQQERVRVRERVASVGAAWAAVQANGALAAELRAFEAAAAERFGRETFEPHYWTWREWEAGSHPAVGLPGEEPEQAREAKGPPGKATEAAAMAAVILMARTLAAADAHMASERQKQEQEVADRAQRQAEASARLRQNPTAAPEPEPERPTPGPSPSMGW